ncbi:MAG: hypothetical protein IRY99_02165 [Isosphaeraceae bacterium]|nr:hypothetical protein [Isosphaeraceae bacterium]
MVFGIWGQPRPRPQERRGFAEKAWECGPLAEWDRRWRGLSVAARRVLLDDLKFPAANPSRRYFGVPAEALPAPPLKELIDAGFVRLQAGRRARDPQEAVVVEEALGFANRVRIVRDLHLLDPTRPPELEKYAKECYYHQLLTEVIRKVIRSAGFEDYSALPHLLKGFVANRRWPEWVVATLKDRLAEPVLETVRMAEDPIPSSSCPSG